MLIGRAEQTLTIRTQQFKAGDMTAKGSGLVVIFAMNVVGYRAAHRNKFRSRADGQKPATWYNEIQHFSQRDACFAPQHTLLFIKGDKAFQISCIEDNTVFVKTTVPVAPSMGKRENRLFKRTEVGQFSTPEYGYYLVRLDDW